MIDMKMSKEEAKEYGESPVTADMDNQERYPWCLRFDLNDEVLEKCGVETLPTVGDEMTITCKVKVIGTRQSATQNTDNRSVELQITELKLPIGSGKDLETTEQEQESDEGNELTRSTTGPMSKVAQKLQNM